MAAMETRNLHHHGQQQQQQQQPYPALPASPTLTNPDMILPDYDRSASPDPDLNDRHHSPLMMWKNAHVASTATVVQHDQQHPDHPYGPTGPITPTTPIIYGNGTMLSDIGEVTEAESTPGRPSPVRSRGIPGGQKASTRGSGSDTALRSSPTMGYEGVLKKRSKQSLAAQRERRSSMESTSTITTNEKQDLFADFDDSVSVGDSVFQGDDEESMADSYTEGTAAREDGARLGPPNTDNTDRLSTYSMSSLSQRAEHILTNAKRRLTTMEGNLARARSSLHASSPSMSSIGSDGSTPSPPVKRASTAIYTHEADPSSPTYPPRVSNDGTFPAPLPYRVTAQRSASALGVSGGYRQPLTASRSVDHLGNFDGQPTSPAYRMSWHQRDRALQPLSEDEVASSQEPNRFSRGAKFDQFLSPTVGSFSDSGNGNDRGLQRSASVAQMRGLKDQVKDLKGKISNLREQARVDSMKRRSLQSLRTPSPFTHAQVDQWYAEPDQPPSSEVDDTSAGASSARNPWNGELSSVDDDEQARESGPEKVTEDEDSIYGEVENETQLRPPENQSPERKIALATTSRDVATMEEDGDDVSDLQTENGDVGREDQDDAVQVDDEEYDSESGESMYHDTVQHAVSHEDREDAFDYEHFFLHSAMGTISQQRMGRRRGSRSSFSSEDSVETTRGPIVESRTKDGSEKTGSGPSRTLQRRSSDASVSTVGTFATANDGSAESIREKEDTLGRLSGQFVTVPAREGSESPETAKKISFAPGNINTDFHLPASRRSTGSISSVPEEESEGKGNHPPNSSFNYNVSVLRRPMSSSAANSLHRPSVSSFESTGTNRSFPLVNRPKKSSSVGILTPHNSTPDQELKAISDSLMNETASICEQQQQGAGANDDGLKGQKAAGSVGGIVDALTGNPNTPEALQTLVRDDQYLVERLVASLGSCVLGLSESGRASTEGRAYRRRIDAARRILEGLDEVV